MTDEELIQQLLLGDGNALDELYLRYSRVLYIFISRLTKSRDPEDLVHQVFMRVIENAHRFDPEKSMFKTWLFTVTRRLCIDYLRSRKNRDKISLDDNAFPREAQGETKVKDLLPAAGKNAEEAYMERELCRAVNECLENLEHKEEKEALILYYLAGKVYREIGLILGKSISMVKKRIMMAREKMKHCLGRKGFDSFPLKQDVKMDDQSVYDKRNPYDG